MWNNSYLDMMADINHVADSHLTVEWLCFGYKCYAALLLSFVNYNCMSLKGTDRCSRNSLIKLNSANSLHTVPNIIVCIITVCIHKITIINKQNKSYVLITKLIISIYLQKNVNNCNKSHILQMSSACIQWISID